MSLVLLLTTDGQRTTLDLDVEDSDATLATLQGAVGGLIEIVPCLSVPGVLVVNEDGIGLELALNVTATVLARQIIVGDVVFVDPETYRRIP